MALDEHIKVGFRESGMKLASSVPVRSMILPFVTQLEGKGESDSVDAHGALDTLKADLFNTSKNWEDIDDFPNRKDFEADIAATPANDTYANWKLQRTPHEEYKRQRTHFFADWIETGYTFNKKEEILEYTSPKSKAIMEMERKIVAGCDARIILAMRSASTPRGKQGSAPRTDTLPVGQAYETQVVDTFGVDDITRIMEILGKNNVNSPVHILISHKHKRQLQDEAGFKFTSRDFVSRTGYFEQGDLPDIYGAHLIPHSFIDDDEFFAFTKESIGFMNFGAEIRELDKNPGQRFQLQAYRCKFADAKRLDDLQFVQGSVKAA